MNSEPSAADAEFRYGAALASQIEAKWQRIWADQGTFETPNPVGRLSNGTALDPARKFYVIDMFPYPSGAGLHVGHPLGYIASDVYARYMRMNGHTVLHPFGFDAFGLPAEQYAIETGQHPAVTTENNIATMRRQLRRLGLTHDPRREISTADPAYYRWTQWIFLQIFNSWCDPDSGKARPIEELIREFEQGSRSAAAAANPDGLPWSELDEVTRRRVVDSYRLAYLDDAPVNWCPGLGTVLANEEVTADGRSQVGNYPGLPPAHAPVDAPHHRLRRPTERGPGGARLDRLAQDHAAELDRPQRGRGHPVPGDRGRPDPGVHDAPGHPLRRHVPGAGTRAPLGARTHRRRWPEGPGQWRGANRPGAAESPSAAVAAYVARTASASDRQRQSEAPKTAVFLGRYAVNPVSGARMPILISDYVLASYGTGAIMAVPAHDQRDYELATALACRSCPSSGLATLAGRAGRGVRRRARDLGRGLRRRRRADQLPRRSTSRSTGSAPRTRRRA